MRNTAFLALKSDADSARNALRLATMTVIGLLYGEFHLEGLMA